MSDPSGTVLPGTTIVSGSGTAWVVSKPQTVSSRAMTGVAVTGSSVQVNINQQPTISADNIAVALI